jgi:hypothetical protein
LALLEFADGNPTPPLGGPDDGGIHHVLRQNPAGAQVVDLWL